MTVLICAGCAEEGVLEVADISELTFPITPRGERSEQTLRLRNTGEGILRITLETEAPYSIPKQRLSFEPGAKFELPITFEPTIPGRAVRTLRIEADGDTKLISLSGSTGEPDRVFLPGCDLGFPRTLTIENGNKTFTWTHRKNEACILNPITFQATDPRFSLDAPRAARTMYRGSTVSITFVGPDDATGEIGVLTAEGKKIPVISGSWSCMQVEPKLRELGQAATGCSRLNYLTVFNECGGTSPIISAELTSGSAGPFSLVGSRGNYLARFEPRAAGVHTATVLFTRADGKQETGFLRGVGFERERRVIRYELPDPPKVDMLLLVDVSPSFVPRRAALREELLRSSKPNTCIDVRVGIVAADGAEPTPRFGLSDAGIWAESRRPDFAGKVVAAFDSLPVGSEQESFVGVAAEALARVEIRSGSLLNVVAITDAADSSAEPVASFLDLKARFPHLRWGSYAPRADSTCAVEAPGDGLLTDFALHTGSSLEDICRVGGPSIAPDLPDCFPYGRFALNGRPEPGTLTVTLNGAPITEWTYTEATRTIDISDAVYLTGVLEISYLPACGTF